MTTIGDLLNLPNTLIKELEYRSDLRTEVLAHKLANKLTGSNMPVDPMKFNPYMDEETGQVKMSLMAPNIEKKR